MDHWKGTDKFGMAPSDREVERAGLTASTALPELFWPTSPSDVADDVDGVGSTVVPPAPDFSGVGWTSCDFFVAFGLDLSLTDPEVDPEATGSSVPGSGAGFLPDFSRIFGRFDTLCQIWV